MKLKSGFVTREMAGEQIMVSSNGTFSGLVRSNAAAAFIVDCLKEETTEAEFIAKMLEKYDAEEAVLDADVKRILDTLRSIGALDE